MFTIEDIGTDARSADGYVVLFKLGKSHTGVLAVPAFPPKSSALRKLSKAIESHARLSVQLESFTIEPRAVGNLTTPNVYEIKFGVKIGTEIVITDFLEFARQARVITNPIVSDMRNFKIK